VAAGGSGGGADSAAVIRPGHLNTFFNVKVREIIAMPRYRQEEEMLDILGRYVAGKEAKEIAREMDLPPDLIEEYTRNFDLISESLKRGATAQEISLQIRKGIDTTRNYIQTIKRLVGKNMDRKGS
jgi:hypothetical protein